MSCRRSRLSAAVSLACMLCLLGSASATSAAPTVKVSGNRLVDGAGTPLRVAGVNRSGSEYACAQGWGIFDGPTDDTSIAAMATWASMRCGSRSTRTAG